MNEKGNWITTRSGQRFDFVNPTVEMLDIEDIAAALSKICRFGGHGRYFYSVAEHCVNVARLTKCFGGDPLSGLLHDAQEAYIGDVPTPLKALLPSYREIEAKIVAQIRCKWGVDIHSEEIIKADRVALWEEGLILMPASVKAWAGYADRIIVAPTFLPQPRPKNSNDAEISFLKAFELFSEPIFRGLCEDTKTAD